MPPAGAFSSLRAARRWPPSLARMGAPVGPDEPVMRGGYAAVGPQPEFRGTRPALTK